MEPDDQVQISGLSAIVRERPGRGPGPWLPEQSIGDRLALRLSYKGHDYYAHLAGSAEEARKLGKVADGSDWHGWVVLVTRTPNPTLGGQILATVPTLEAAIVGALSAVFAMHARQRA